MIIARCALHPESLEEMESYFTKCEADGLTNRQVFHNNKELEQFRALAMRNRRRVCYEFADAIGATIRFRSYSKSAKPCKIANLVCETEVCSRRIARQAGSRLNHPAPTILARSPVCCSDQLRAVSQRRHVPVRRLHVHHRRDRRLGLQSSALARALDLHRAALSVGARQRDVRWTEVV